MKKSIAYIHFAINLNGGIEPIGYLDSECQVPSYDGGLKANYQHAKDWVGNMWYDYDFMAADVIRGRQLNRTQFKKEYSSYRLYCAQADEEKYERIKKFKKPA